VKGSLDDSNRKFLMGIWLGLLKDVPTVAMNCGSSIAHLAKQLIPNETSKAVAQQVVKAFNSCQTNCQANWRVHARVLRDLEVHLVALQQSEVVYEHFVPKLMELLLSAVVQISSQATDKSRHLCQ